MYVYICIYIYIYIERERDEDLLHALLGFPPPRDDCWLGHSCGLRSPLQRLRCNVEWCVEGHGRVTEGKIILFQ